MLNLLAPEAYSMANLTLILIVKGLVLKVDEPWKVWRALHSVDGYGADYFLSIIEE
jgi:hypothetical protein